MILIMKGLHVHWEKMAFLLKKVLACIYVCDDVFVVTGDGAVKECQSADVVIS